MDIITKLLSYGWIQGIIMLSLLKLGVYVFRILNKNNPKFKLQDKDDAIELLVSVIFFGVPFIAQFALGIKNIFWYALTFAVIGILCEFLFDYIWYRLMGTRLYRYFKHNILGFTSWFIFPYWAAAGLYFYGSWQFIEFLAKEATVRNLNIFNMLKDLSLIVVFTSMLTIFFFGVWDYLNHKLGSFTGFKWNKYILLVVVIWIPIMYLIFTLNNIYVLIYFGLTSIVGLLLEGMLSNKLRNLYGESFWLYYRYNIFNHGTSLLVLPVWGAAALLAFLLFNFYLY